jgi:hypothetical protein
MTPRKGGALMIWWFYHAVAVYDPGRRWHPFHGFRVGTCLFQWGLIIAFLVLTNRYWAERVGGEGQIQMSVSGYIVMTVVVGGIWGGFVYLLYRTVRPEKR